MVGESKRGETAAMWRRKKTNTLNGVQSARLLQMVKASKQQENESSIPKDFAAGLMTLALCHVRHATVNPPSLAGHSSACLPELPPKVAGSMSDTLQPGLLYAYWAAFSSCQVVE
jgi:hypothetical protein